VRPRYIRLPTNTGQRSAIEVSPDVSHDRQLKNDVGGVARRRTLLGRGTIEWLPLLGLVAAVWAPLPKAWAQVPFFWYNDLRAHVARHVHHPGKGRCATARQGTVLLQFTIDRGGRVIDVRVAKTSGIQDWDREAIGAVKSASPLPPAPDQIPGQRLRFELPVSFVC
jgi:TonB family protein